MTLTWLQSGLVDQAGQFFESDSTCPTDPIADKDHGAGRLLPGEKWPAAERKANGRSVAPAESAVGAA